jgi:hypothetical protein
MEKAIKYARKAASAKMKKSTKTSQDFHRTPYILIITLQKKL